MEKLSNPQVTIETIKKYNFAFQKRFGQNFLIDGHVIEKIIRAADISKDDVVLEIGPGIGTMTQYLAETAGKVYAVEIDKNLIPILEDTLSDYDNVTVINEDILKLDIGELIKEEKGNLKVVANLPYYITTPIIMGLLENHIPAKSITVMVQKEVGDRFAAKPSSKEYNSLTVYLNYYFNIKKLFVVSRNVFVPKPNVDSIVIELSKKEDRLLLKNDDLFFKLVRDSFKYKRKNLRNNLKEYDLSKVEEVLKKHGYDLTIRAEALSLELFVEISNNLS